MTNLRKIIKAEIEDSINIKKNLLETDSIMDSLDVMINLCIETIKNKGKVIFAGNGGSFADSQHLAAEFVSRFRFDRNPLPSIALATNSSSMTAIGNDYDFSDIFSRELEVIGKKKDLFIPISTSGNSKNIIKAIQAAKKINMKIFGLSGNSGGEMSKNCDCLIIPSESTARIQECHIMIGHILCGSVEDKIFEELKPL